MPSLQATIASLIASLSEEPNTDPATWNSDAFRPPAHSRSGPDNAWDLRMLGPGDERGVCWALDTMSDDARKFSAVLLHDERLHTADLADQVGFEGHLPSVFRSMAGRFRAIERAPFWYGTPETKAHPRGQVLYVSPGGEPYEVMLKVMQARYPELLGTDGSQAVPL